MKIWYGSNDYLVSEADSERLISQLALDRSKAILTDYNHLDFLWVKKKFFISILDVR